MISWRKALTAAAVTAGLAALAVAWQRAAPDGLPPGIAGGNGRLEATTIDIAAKAGGRVQAVRVREGDFVQAGEEVARIDTLALAAQLRGAEAQARQARSAQATDAALARQREQSAQTARALAAQRESELALAEKELRRTADLVARNFIAPQQLDAAQARVQGARAALSAARSQVLEAEAAIATARAQAQEGGAAIEAALANVERLQTEIADALLVAPRAGRVQLRLVNEGEVVGGGARIVSLVDLSDVTMSFYLPETAAGRVAIGSEARLVLDAAPELVIPARIDFVASVAQFTPKTVETQSERQKMVFKVRARIDPALLARHREQVKTGLPGMAYVRIADVEWPRHLQVALPAPRADGTVSPASPPAPRASAAQP
ncbi:HlyD family secretion protein [Caldimonas tepidiphila]|uniref:HlyD family secretion protein n=1 Tax=Caldimonas tepidiphila TaxID=2315841 RepID=UPI000E5BA777|nr:HlyD family efflux transporter periplasmic adaptor subunit [Caldimonas tepidiphila]